MCVSIHVLTIKTFYSLLLALVYLPPEKNLPAVLLHKGHCLILRFKTYLVNHPGKLKFAFSARHSDSKQNKKKRNDLSQN